MYSVSVHVCVLVQYVHVCVLVQYVHVCVLVQYVHDVSCSDCYISYVCSIPCFLLGVIGTLIMYCVTTLVCHLPL